MFQAVRICQITINPSHSSVVVQFWSVQSDAEAAATGAPMAEAFDAFQGVLNQDPDVLSIDPTKRVYGVRNFSEPIDIGHASLFMLDVRTRRERIRRNPESARMVARADMQAFETWCRTLEKPGLLVIAQPLIEKRLSALEVQSGRWGDANCPDYWSDHSAILHAIAKAPRDIAMLSGDIHWSRMRLLEVDGRAIYEVVASPFAKIPLLPAKADKAHGGTLNVEAPIRSARWSRYDATNKEYGSGYATITLTSAGSCTVMEVRWWKANLDPNRGPDLIETLRIRLY